MNSASLLNHKFQFVSFCPVFHADSSGPGRMHINDDCHLLHITRGAGAIFVEEKKYRLRPGMVAAIPPFVRFYFKINAPFEMLNIHYRLWLADGGPLEERAVLPIIFRPKYFGTLAKILRHMQEMRQKDLPERLRLAPLAHEVVLLHLTSTPLREKERQIVDARLMNAGRRLSDPNCTAFRAAEVARLCGLSMSQMNRLFQKCFRMSPHQFWEQKRFGELCRQLRAGEHSVSQIAAQSGFEDAAYFSRWFRKMAGCAPAEFRRHSI